MKRIAQIFSDSEGEEEPGFKPPPKRTSEAGKGNRFVNPALSDAGKNFFKFKKEVLPVAEANDKKRKHIEAFKEMDPPSKRRPEEKQAIVVELDSIGHVFSKEFKAKEAVSLKQPVKQ